MFTLGVVPYLNALPLYRTLETSGQARFLRAVPAQLSPRLAADECDAALIPIVDHFRGVGSEVISDACIGSNGPVRSVLLFTTVPVQQISSVAIDTSSHTSVALLRIILSDGYGVQPPFIDHAPDLPAMLSGHDAALLIGDKALEAVEMAQSKNLNILDLGHEWTHTVTQKPFVYAAWVTRHDLAPAAQEDLAALLNTARDEGVSNLETIVRHNPIQTRLSPTQILDYLTRAIEFDLTPAHRTGMAEFQRRCEKHNLLNDFVS